MFSELMMRSTASAKSSQTANGGGVIDVSSPARYFPREGRDQVNLHSRCRDKGWPASFPDSLARHPFTMNLQEHNSFAKVLLLNHPVKKGLH